MGKRRGPDRRVPAGRYIWGPATDALTATPTRTAWTILATVLEIGIFLTLIVIGQVWVILPLGITVFIVSWVIGRELALRDALRSELEDAVRGIDDEA